MSIKKIGILYHPMVAATLAKSKEVEQFLLSQGISVWTCSAWELEKARAQLNQTDLIVSSGGDGTILRAVQVALQTQTPIVGINMGKLGFLTELGAAEALEKMPGILAGKGWIDERSLLEAELFPTGKEKESASIFHALNDVVVARGAIARLINIDACIDDERVTTYRADGVIIATATGSTGYSLAAGGPILHARSDDFILAPIVSHLGLNYSLVLSAQATVKLSIATTHQATLSVDGHMNIAISNGAVVKIKHSAQKARFLRIHPENYFYSSLEQKLKGKK